MFIVCSVSISLRQEPWQGQAQELRLGAAPFAWPVCFGQECCSESKGEGSAFVSTVRPQGEEGGEVRFLVLVSVMHDCFWVEVCVCVCLHLCAYVVCATSGSDFVFAEVVPRLQQNDVGAAILVQRALPHPRVLFNNSNFDKDCQSSRQTCLFSLLIVGGGAFALLSHVHVLCTSTDIFVHLSFDRCIYPYIDLPTYMCIHWLVNLSTCQSISLAIYQLMRLIIDLYVHGFTVLPIDGSIYRSIHQIWLSSFVTAFTFLTMIMFEQHQLFNKCEAS